jgi:ubiquinone biosynthesis protein Coq4
MGANEEANTVGSRMKRLRRKARAVTKSGPALKAAGAALRLMTNTSSNPLGDYISIANLMYTPEALAAAVAVVSETASGRQALETRPVLKRVSMDELEALPAGTLGRELWSQLREADMHGKMLPGLPSGVDSPTDPQAAWILRHYFETHDIWRTVTGFPMTRPGEGGLFAFTAAQLPTRMDMLLAGIAIASGALIRYGQREEHMNYAMRGWLFGKSLPSLVGVDWHRHFGRPLVEVRRELGYPEEGLLEAPLTAATATPQS